MTAQDALKTLQNAPEAAPKEARTTQEASWTPQDAVGERITHLSF